MKTYIVPTTEVAKVGTEVVMVQIGVETGSGAFNVYDSVD